ncbi:helix-turn-helix domain-containing protein [Streptomyces sp. NPDC001273]
MAGHHSARPHDPARALAQRPRALREARGWTRERLAEEAGISAKTLARLESEGAIQPGFFTVGLVADALVVSLDDLFRETKATPGLWSAGYEGRDIDSFVASLVGSRINVVADVRLTPISRKKGSSKTRLGGRWPTPASSTPTPMAVPRPCRGPKTRRTRHAVPERDEHGFRSSRGLHTWPGCGVDRPSRRRLHRSTASPLSACRKSPPTGRRPGTLP